MWRDWGQTAEEERLDQTFKYLEYQSGDFELYPAGTGEVFKPDGDAGTFMCVYRTMPEQG